MWFLIAVVAAVALLIAYQFWIHPALHANHITTRFCPPIESTASWLWDNSRTILIARLYIILPFIIFVHDYIATNWASLDLTPVWKRVFTDVPEDLRPLIVTGIFMVTGLIFELLRRYTSQSLKERAKTRTPAG